MQLKPNHTTRSNLTRTNDVKLNYYLNIQRNTTSDSDYDESINESDELSDENKIELISIKAATFSNLISRANSLHSHLNETSDNDHDEDSSDTSTEDDSYFESNANSIKMTNFKIRKHL